MAKMVDTKKDSVTFRATSKDEEGRKRVEKFEVHTHDPDTLKYTEKKLIDKGVLRQDRHPVDGLGPVHKPPPKSGHGGKFTWEGPDDFAANELEAPVALDPGDPNFVDEEERRARDAAHEEAEAGIVVGEVEVAKAAEDRVGVARVEVSPPIDLNAVRLEKFRIQSIDELN